MVDLSQFVHIVPEDYAQRVCGGLAQLGSRPSLLAVTLYPKDD
jgi:hypothetical protein